MILPNDYDHFYTPPFAIDVKECGVWDSIEYFEDLQEALKYASALCRKMDEHKIRILDKNNKII